MMPAFQTPMINLYARDLPRLQAFYEGFGFVETFRVPKTGVADHVELRLDGFTLGIARIEAAAAHHGLAPKGDGRWIEIILWTDDLDTAYADCLTSGSESLSEPHVFLEGRLKAAWIADPEGNPVQFVQKLG